MGLDLYIEARITEKDTRRIISADQYEVSDDDEEDGKGFFEICWWCSWDFCDVRSEIIEISNRHAGTTYTDEDFWIPVPQSALRDIYAYLTNRSCLPESIELFPGDIEWEKRESYEAMNLTNAVKLHEMLRILNNIKYYNDIYMEGILKDHIPGADDLSQLKENPQAYEWDFRIFNSY